MGAGDESGRQRVLVPHALGAEEFLRVTWHQGQRAVVFSHWQGDTCVAATPVKVDDIGELADLLAAADAQPREVSPWAPPRVETPAIEPSARRTA